MTYCAMLLTHLKRNLSQNGLVSMHVLYVVSKAAHMIDACTGHNFSRLISVLSKCMVFNSELVRSYILSCFNLPYKYYGLTNVVAYNYARNINLETFLSTGHKCEQKGCGTVLVADGNMKNARTVCSVKNVGQLIFEGI